MRTIVIIPARFASERLPGKPLMDIAGKPMIQHVFERASKSHSVNSVVVATDDDRIAAAVRAFGGEAVMTPREIRSGTDRIAFVARTLTDSDIIVNVQGDEPLIDPSIIDQAVAPLESDLSTLVATPIRKIDAEEDLLNPNTTKVVVDHEAHCLYFSRSVIPYCRDGAQGSWLRYGTFYKHIGLYVFRREFLLEYATMSRTPLERAEKLEQLRILEHGFRIRAVLTDYDSIPVDTPADLKRVREIMRGTP
ncbi:MAG: 3-deoxy-manno-octulosonate cytidylyltransferase [Bacteroidetes bacterium]|nr:3-deoxy-manno-octulosonate cytidylyltransferase [Bacteroidota bacterium]